MKTELLAPAGSMEALKAAVSAGADAVYLGGAAFGARAYAKNLDEQEILSAIDYVHLRNRKLYLFLNRYGDRITTRGISQQLKNYADKYGLDKKVVYPHSFRHRYAKNFLEKYNDIALLADLMGHESIETTRIYLRRTASEQQALVDKIVTW